MTESRPPMMPEQFRQLKRDLMEKILNRAASDPGWKQRLLDDPDAAIQEADFPELRQLREMQAGIEAKEEAEVAGQMSASQPVDALNCVFTQCSPHPVYKSI
jgi:hypothetical protein